MEELLALLAANDIRLRLEGGRLKCDAPKGVLTPEIGRQITAHREELLAHLGREQSQGQGTREAGPAKGQAGSGPRPLSFAQSRLLVLEELGATAAAYILPALLHLEGELDEDLLAEALLVIVKRHEVLRTTYAYHQGAFQGLVAATADSPLCRYDLSRLDLAEQQRESRRLSEEITATPFDLGRETPLRVALLRLGERRYLLALALHHSAGDGWSIGIFQRELAAAYNALVAGRPVALAELPLQYADFAAWQQQRFSGAYRDEKCAYWLRELQGAPQVLNLPSDRPRPRLQTFNGAKVNFTLDPATLQTLRQSATENGATLFMLLLAAFGLLLQRSSGQDDLLVGIPMHNRVRPELEPLIGYFSDTVPVRLRLGGEPTFPRLLTRIRQAAIGAYENQDLPFDLLVNALKPQRDLSRNPLVQVMFALQNAPLHGPRAQLELTGLEVTALELAQPQTRLELELHLWETPEGLSGTLFYNTDLFFPATAAKICRRYTRLLTAIAADPLAPVARLPWLEEEELHLVTRQWNDTQRDFPDQETIFSRFAALVKANPRAPALVSGSVRLNRGELALAAARIAAWLRQEGLQPGGVVGICTRRCWCGIAAMLGVLQAGGVYLPLEPEHPSARRQLTAADAGAALMLTDAAVNHRLDPWWQGPRLVIDADRLPEPLSGAVPREAGDLCYIIYTSGSTGSPKGVCLRHRGVVNLVEECKVRLKLSEEDVWSLFHSPAFDFSVWEIWGALLSGGTLVTVAAEVSRDPEAFYRLVVEEQVTILNQTPAALGQFADCYEATEHGVQLVGNGHDLAANGKVKRERGEIANLSPGERPPALRLIICGGETLPVSLAARVLAWGVPLWNFYGPTETTVWAAVHRVVREDLHNSAIPAGRPIANMQLYLLDPAGNPLPANTPGELWIGGVGVAAGYRNRPELTRERFVADPFGRGSGGHLYRTGDLAKFAPDGTLTILGRLDRQVKLRGFRIELGEIEHALHALCPRAQVAVVVRPGGGEDRLVAYLGLGSRNGEPEQLPSGEELKQQLRLVLPEYMVPRAIIILAELPLSPSGKLDLGALPQTEEPVGVREYRAPVSAGEKMLAAAWAAELGRERVGLDDNFFDLGASSLQVVKIYRALRTQFKAEHLHSGLAVTDFFRYPTVGSLAAYLASGTETATATGESLSQQRSAARRQALERQRNRSRGATRQ